jgi:hypothetical protein
MPRGEVARAIDECGSCMCPLWPFRFGRDPWRPEPSEAQLEAIRATGEKGRLSLEATRRSGAEPGGDGTGPTTPCPTEPAPAGVATQDKALA